jgi:chitodextrinase
MYLLKLAKPSWKKAEMTNSQNQHLKIHYDLLVTVLVLVFMIVPSDQAHCANTPSFVQKAELRITMGSRVSVNFSSSNTAGNLIIAYLVWDNSGSASISDSRGNTYSSAIGPTKYSGDRANAQIFYASNIAGGTNTVTATFSTTITACGILYIHEYSGVKQTSPVDSVVSATGWSSSMNSGNLSTSNANDLLFAGGESGNTVTKPGNGYTARSSSYGNMTEEKIASTAGSYSATATQNGRAWILQLVAFKPIGSSADTLAPTVPTGLSANIVSPYQINLSWNASTDNVGVAGYKVFRNSSQIATVTSGTSYQDASLTPNTTYSFSVSAYDQAGNNSAQSTAVNATTPALPAPTIGSFTANPISITAGQASCLSWSVSNATSLNINNNVGSVTGLTSKTVNPATNTTYTLTATNAYGSSSAQATIIVVPDTQAPTVPTSLIGTPASFSQINLSWTASTDNVGVAGYKVFRNGSQIATITSGAAYQDASLTPNTTYSYTVSAYDVAGNNSAQSTAVNATTPALPVPTIGSFIANPISIAAGQSSTLSWSVSNATSLNINNNVGSVTGLTSKIVNPATNTTYTLTATNAYGSSSAQATIIVVPDTQAPTVPTNLIGTPASFSQINLSWTASTDNVGVAGYNIFRDGISIANTTATSFSDTGLVASTMYGYRISAYDAAGNTSAQSSSVSAMTQAQASGNTYITNFPLTENPIYENGNWIGGSTAGGNLWGDIQTAAGMAFGVSEPTSYGDPTAILTGIWAPEQTASAIVKINTMPSGTCCYEDELRLRTTVSTQSITGYEVYCSVTAENPYCHIASWGGPNGAWVNMESNPPHIYLKDGDILKASVTGTNPVTITAYVNDTQIMTVQDTGNYIFSDGRKYGPWISGNPGIGFYGNQDSNWSDFGFSSFTATDSASTDTQAPSIPANLAATTVSSTQINLSWTSSTDNVSVLGYNIYRNGIQIGVSANNSYSDSGLAPSTTYTYAVSAFDDAANVSALSSSASATTSSSTGPGQAWSHIQTKARNSSASSNALAFTANTISGNLLIAEIDWTGGSTFTSISDTQGNVWTQIGTEQNASGVGVKSRLYYAKNIKGGADTVTTIVSGSPSYHELYIHEYSGLSTSNPIDSFAINMGTGSSFTSNSLTTTSANDLLYGIEIDSAGATAVTGWTTRSTLNGNVAADKNAAAIGSYAFTGRSAGAFLAWLVAFR